MSYFDPDVAEVISEAAASAAEEVAAWQAEQHQSSMASVALGQQELAWIEAARELQEKYGEAEFERLRPLMAQRIERNPHLLPASSMTSPSALARGIGGRVEVDTWRGGGG